MPSRGMTFYLFLTVFFAVAVAEDFQQVKLLDVQVFTAAGPSIVAPNNGTPLIIPTSRKMFTITVALDGIIYSAQYQETRHFKPAELIVGDTVQARIDGDKLILRTKDGKETKGKIVRRERPSQE